MNPNIFREYDIRGTYPETINETVAYTIGRSYGSYLKEKYNQTYRQLDKSTLSFSYKIRLFIARYFLTFYGRVMEWNHNRMERKWKREV